MLVLAPVPHSRLYLIFEKYFEELFKDLNCEFVRYDDADLNTRRYFYDWKEWQQDLSNVSVTSFEDEPVYGGRRLWVVKKQLSNDQ